MFLSSAIHAAALLAISGHDTKPDPELPESYPVAQSMINSDLYMPVENGAPISYKIERLDNNELLLRTGKHTYINNNLIGVWPLQTKITKYVTDIFELHGGIHFATVHGVAILAREKFSEILQTLAFENLEDAEFEIQMDVQFKKESKEFMERVLEEAGIDPYGTHSAKFQRIAEVENLPIA